MLEFTLESEVIKLLGTYIARIRPPENIRPQLDIAYKIVGQSVFIIEIRPQFNNPDKKIEIEVAKTTFIKASNHWKVFWLRSTLKWESYQPQPIVKSIEGFIEIVEKDEFGCFWG
jgi:hypothetical protein